MVAIVAWASFILSLVAIGFAYKLQQELGVARGRLDRYNRALFGAEHTVRQLQNELAETSAKLRVEMMQRTGDSKVDADMTLREILLVHPQADSVLAGFHIGGCSSCAFEPDDTLASVCAQGKIDVRTVVHDLNMLADGAHAGHGSVPAPAKLPNVELEL